jgi:hypothetical protein
LWDSILPWQKQSIFNYDLVDSVKEWHSEWFYGGNMLPGLAVHFDSGPSVNDHWEKIPLSIEELKKIQPLLDRI